jgi:NAD(P)H dehydrogenase (quinone)
VADVLAAILTGDGHDGHSYDITGPEALTVAEIAAQLTELTGRPIAYEDETLAQARASRSSYGAPDWQVEAWISTYTAIAAGELATISDTVSRLARHEPTTLAAYVRAHPDCLDHVTG